MLKFFLRRLLAIIPIVFGVIVVVFLTLKLIPGDPASALLGASATPSQRKQLIAELGLNRSIFVQFWNWFVDVLQGDLGRSILRQQPVGPMVMDAFWNTMILAIGASVIAIVGGLVIGGASALWPRTHLRAGVQLDRHRFGVDAAVLDRARPDRDLRGELGGPPGQWDVLHHRARRTSGISCST